MIAFAAIVGASFTRTAHAQPTQQQKWVAMIYYEEYYANGHPVAVAVYLVDRSANAPDVVHVGDSAAQAIANLINAGGVDQGQAAIFQGADGSIKHKQAFGSR